MASGMYFVINFFKAFFESQMSNVSTSRESTLSNNVFKVNKNS